MEVGPALCARPGPAVRTRWDARRQSPRKARSTCLSCQHRQPRSRTGTTSGLRAGRRTSPLHARISRRRSSPRRRRCRALRKQYVLRARARPALTSALLRRIRVPPGGHEKPSFGPQEMELPARGSAGPRTCEGDGNGRQQQIEQRSVERLALHPGSQCLDQFLLTGSRTGTRKGVAS